MAQIPESYEGETADRVLQRKMRDAEIVAAGPQQDGLAGWLGWDSDWRAAKARHSGEHSLAGTPWWLMPSKLMQDAISKGIGFSPERSLGENIAHGGVNTALAFGPLAVGKMPLRGGGGPRSNMNIPPRGSTIPKQQVTAARTAKGLRRANTRAAQQRAATERARIAEQQGLGDPGKVAVPQPGNPGKLEAGRIQSNQQNQRAMNEHLIRTRGSRHNLPARTQPKSVFDTSQTAPLGVQRLRHALGGGRGDTVTGGIKSHPRPAIYDESSFVHLLRMGRGTKGGHTPTAAELASANPATQQAALAKLLELSKITSIPSRVSQAGGQPRLTSRPPTKPLLLTGPKAATRNGWLKDNWGKISAAVGLLAVGGESIRRLTKDEAATVTKATNILEGMQEQPVNAAIDAKLSEEEGTTIDENGEVKEKRFTGSEFYLRRATIHKEFVRDGLDGGEELSSLDAEGASDKIYDMARYHDGIVSFSPKSNKFVVVNPQTWREVKKWSPRRRELYETDKRQDDNMQRVRDNLPHYEAIADKKRERNVKWRIKELRRKGGRLTVEDMDELHSLQTGHTDKTHPTRLLKMGAFNSKNGTVNWGEYRKYEALHDKKVIEPRPHTEQEKMWAQWMWQGNALKSRMNSLREDKADAVKNKDRAAFDYAKKAIKELELKADDAEKKYINSTADLRAGPAPYVDPRHDDKYQTPLHRMIQTIKDEKASVNEGTNEVDGEFVDGEFVKAPHITKDGEPVADALKMINPVTGKKESVAPSFDASGLASQFDYIGFGKTGEEDAANLRALVTALESNPELPSMFERYLRAGAPAVNDAAWGDGTEGRGPVNVKKYLDDIVAKARVTKHGRKDKALGDELADLKIRLYQAFGMGKKPIRDREEGFWSDSYDIPGEALSPEQKRMRHQWILDSLNMIDPPLRRDGPVDIEEIKAGLPPEWQVN